MLYVRETNKGDISEIPGGGSHSQGLLGEAKGSLSSAQRHMGEVGLASLHRLLCLG